MFVRAPSVGHTALRGPHRQWRLGSGPRAPSQNHLKRNHYALGPQVQAGGRFPISPEASTNNVSSAAPASSRQQAIILVDDEVDILESLKQLFEVSIKGVKVITAEGGQAALQLL